MTLSFTRAAALAVACSVSLVGGTLLASCSSGGASKADQQPAPVVLEVGEGFSNPIGYYESTPRFSWQLASDGAGHYQSAYQIQVAASAEGLDRETLWDSGKVVSAQTSWIRYGGAPFDSRQQAVWRVRTWDENGQMSRWSEVQSIELGLLSNDDWQGQWIGHPDTELSQQPSVQVLATPQYLRTEFALESAIKKARLYITAKGLFKPFINGQQVAPDDVMTPGWTPYDERIETLTYDVTSLLKTGDNVLAASLAGGWYSGRVADLMALDHQLPPRLLAQLEVTFSNGERQIIGSDASWKASQQGPIQFASTYDGERYEQRLEMAGWSDSNFDDSDWQQAVVEPILPTIKLAPKRHAPIRITQAIPAIEVWQPSEGVAVFDLGQNMVGVPRLQIPVRADQQVTIRYAEALHKGEFYTDNYRSAKVTDHYIPSVTGTADYTPTFTYRGFRYVEISGFDASQKPSQEWVTGLVQHSDFEIRASFESSHSKLNKLADNIVWGLRGNFYDIPLDCPQRDERLGWTGDAQVFVTPSMYMADVYGFWSAWLQSVREEQGDDGKIPLYIPFVEWINFASSGWGDAVTIIPWQLYQLTGDDTILRDNYAMMKGWLDYHQSQMKDDRSTMMTFGDWLQPYPVAEGKKANRGDTEFDLISTAFYAHSLQLTINAAEVLGYQQDIAPMKQTLSKLKGLVRNTFYDQELKPKTGVETQTSYLLPLAFDLFNPAVQEVAFAHLLEQLAKADNHLRTGFLGTPLLIQVLHERGRDDLVYDLLFKESYPSWFYSVNNGATTTWERWNSYTLKDGFNPQGMNSLNHYAYGTVSRYFYEGILGIQPLQPGFKEILIAPKFGQQLDQASGDYQTPHGDVAVSWQRTGRAVELSVTVPKNTQATIELPQLQRTSLQVNGEAVVNENQLQGLKPGTYRVVGQLQPEQFLSN
ncbi:family 78 glycoside hydrolase catalytic domain [Neiella sp. HB171785]|uniref:alpha-L-rhamnosidase n=1 Tax=Neiella litorisoli TaxID=2771431 RepID=A0A8J6QQD8_9GAMM|nr:alpha-L-rhamnosidase [Neiella litorisoli]MBD1388654.1 family 78 glycoside hydrolase catalytic domain [Neiella litorisoli]